MLKNLKLKNIENHIKPTLLIPAAGMGSRYGGLKQMDSMGPSGETLMDYSIFDAIKAGFGKVIFIIRHDFEEDFKKVFSKERFNNQIDVDYVFQSLDKIPKQFTLNAARKKPWGAGHALLMAKDIIKEPFAVINADDFYGKESFQIVANFLLNCDLNASNYCMAGDKIGNTLSEMGGVTRAICTTNDDKTLKNIDEYKNIENKNGIIQNTNSDGTVSTFDYNAITSMNFWGFTPVFMKDAEMVFNDFLKENINSLEAECHIPYLVKKLIKQNKAKIYVKDTDSKWIGITWIKDKPTVMQAIKSKVEAGEYPNNLWKI